MVTSAHAKLALNFFYLLLSDELLAVTAAAKAVENFRKKLEFEKIDKQVLFIKEMVKTLEKLQIQSKNKQIVGTHLMRKGEWEIPNPGNISRWKEFLKKSDGQSEIVLVLRYVLDLPVKVIAAGLEVPEGTILYRIGRGLETLAGTQ